MKIIVKAAIVTIMICCFMCACASGDNGGAQNRLDVVAMGKGASRATLVTTAESGGDNDPGNTEDPTDPPEITGQVILNTNSKLIHTDPECTSVKSMKESNKKTIDASEIHVYLENGYKYCSRCSSEYNGEQNGE